MFEIKRILLSKKTILPLIMILILNFVLFGLNCSENRYITLTENELKEYINVTYPMFLKSTKEQAERFNMLSVFGEERGFSRKNIYKTDEDYKRLSNIIPQYGENRGIVALSNFHLTDILFIIMLFITAFTFAEESKKGLIFIVRSTVNGRINLALYRIGSLLIGALLYGVLLYAGNITAAVINFQDAGFGRAIQSIPEFMHCPYKITIAQYLIFSIIIKCVAGFAVSVLFYFLISIFDTVMAVIGCAFLTVVSFVSYFFILPTSSLNILKFANIFALIRTDDLFKEYCNLNIFGVPKDMLFVSVFVLILILLAAIPASVLAGGLFCRKVSFGFLSSSYEKMSVFISEKSLQLPLFLWEGKKILIKQKGIIFIIICFYLALSAALDYRYFVSIDEYELMWHETYDGVITEELVNQIHEKDIELDNKINILQERLPELTSNTAIDNQKQKIEEYLKQKDSLQTIMKQAEDGLNYYLESGNEVWLIKPYSYKLLLLDDKKTFQRNNIYILLGIIGALAGIMANEKRHNMEFALKATQRGRKEMIVIKLIWVFLITAIFAVAVHLIQFLMVKAAVEYSSIEVPVQSLAFLRGFPFLVSIKQFLVLLFIAYAGAAFLCGIAVFFVSRFRRDKISVMGICVFGMVLPYILFII